MNRQVLKNEALQRDLQEKGYVKMPLLSAQEVAAILDFIETLQPDDGFKPKGDDPSRPSTYHCSFLDTNVAYKRKVHEFLSAMFEPHTKKILCDYKILSINFYVKQPGAGVFQIHQNWPTVPIEDTSVTVWCPLLDVSEQNGGIHVVEGNHKIVPDIASLHAPIFFKQFENELIQDYLKPIPMLAGEVLVFDDSLIHWSPQNNSDKPRYAIQIEMLPQEITPTYFHYDKPSNKFEIFAIDTDYYVTHTITDLFERPKGLRSLGFLNNPNKEISLETFKQKMKDGAKTRAKIYNSQKNKPSENNPKLSFIQKARNIFKILRGV